MNAQVLMVTKMIMFMQEYVSEVEDHAWIEYEEECSEFYSNGWCCKSCIAIEVGLDNLPYIGIEPAVA